MENVFRNTESTFDNLLLTGQVPTVTDTVIVAKGQTLKRGTVVAYNDTDTDEVSPVEVDGALPWGVIAEDVTTGDEPGEAVVYLMAELNADALIFGSGTASDHKRNMRIMTLIVRDAQVRR
jgi:hypothetical protein